MKRHSGFTIGPLAGHRATDELWPMNVLALWTRPRRRKQAIIERYERSRVSAIPGLSSDCATLLRKLYAILGIRALRRFNGTGWTVLWKLYIRLLYRPGTLDLPAKTYSDISDRFLFGSTLLSSFARYCFCVRMI